MALDKSRQILRVMTMNPEGDVNVCSCFTNNPSRSCLIHCTLKHRCEPHGRGSRVKSGDLRSHWGHLSVDCAKKVSEESFICLLARLKKRFEVFE